MKFFTIISVVLVHYRVRYFNVSVFSLKLCNEAKFEMEKLLLKTCTFSRLILFTGWREVLPSQSAQNKTECKHTFRKSSWHGVESKVNDDLVGSCITTFAECPRHAVIAVMGSKSRHQRTLCATFYVPVIISWRMTSEE